MLDKFGYLLSKDRNVWHRANYTGISYSDGDATENAIFEIISGAKDLSVLSEELGSQCVDWPTAYHLSSRRANLLRPLERLFAGDVLEIGSGCGAITRFLGECGGNVLALEGSIRRAAITRARTRDLNNVTVVADNFDTFKCDKLFDVVTMIGVFEYAEMFMSGPERALKMLRKARELLKPNGKLIVAIENQLGLKYFAGAPEDHLWLPMYGIEGRYESGQPRTFGRRELTRLLELSGYVKPEFLAPFPDYKLPLSVISEHGFAEPTFDAGALAWQSAGKDPQLPNTLNFSPIFAWPIVARNGLALDLASSFLVVANTDQEATLSDKELAWHFSTGRKKPFCKVTQFKKNTTSLEVEYYRPTELGQAERSAASASMHQTLPANCGYQQGVVLSWELLRILGRDDWRVDELVEFSKKYLGCIASVCEADGYPLRKSLLESTLPGYLWDCIPQNITENGSGRYFFIDREWRYVRELDVACLLYRGLTPAFHFVACYDRAEAEFDGTRIGLLQAVFEKLGLPVSRQKILEYAVLEAQICAEIGAVSVNADTLVTWLADSLPVRLNSDRALSTSLASVENLSREMEALKRESEQMALRLSHQQLFTSDLARALGLSEEALFSLYPTISSSPSNNREPNRRLSEQRRQKLSVAEIKSDITTTTSPEEDNEQGLNDTFAPRDTEILRLHEQISELRDELIQTTRSLKYSSALLQTVLNSKSWRATESFREVARKLRMAKKVLGIVPYAIAHGGGIKKTLSKAGCILKNEGLNGVKQRLRSVEARRGHRSLSASITQKESLSPSRPVPFYIDPRLDRQTNRTQSGLSAPQASIALHVNIVSISHASDAIKFLQNIPFKFDLLVSCPNGNDLERICHDFDRDLPLVEKLVKRILPDGQTGTPSLILGFGDLLLSYSIIGHFCTASFPPSSIAETNPVSFREWKLMLGSPGTLGGRIVHIIDKLKTTNKLVFPEEQQPSPFELKDSPAYYSLIERLRDDIQDISSNELHSLEFPKLSCFWARRDFLEPLLKIPDLFTKIGADKTNPSLNEAFNYLLFALSLPVEGVYARLHEGDSIADFQDYEPQIDFSSSLIHDDLKVLAFYLPQFHPIPENDEWHGEGFTEWTKVRSANPLFEGHYQQHIPHPDLGYYVLDSANVLHKQAELMRKSGVHGQIFYHYWFGGKLILEKPAQMLLKTPDVDMPFCFCWANENWTRRWDGNESEVLLAQKYSEDDAKDFIRYLLPFFKDPRYIRVQGRPVLFVYRPSSIPNPKSYLRIWEEECIAAGLKAPYVVAVLTRGALDPNDFGMDGGVERVLHDWTDGAVPDIKHSLKKYTQLNGSILSYGDVASFYSKQDEKKNFTYFRSIVPIWDNTARYGKDAYVVHGSRPELFQQWFEALVRYSKQNLPLDRRFIIVNAWNEWAEGAHLEPDSRYGYSYLNSIGRCLSGLKYGEKSVACLKRHQQVKVHLVAHPNLLRILSQDPLGTEQLSKLLSQSSIFKSCKVTASDNLLPSICSAERADFSEADVTVEIRKLALFSPRLLEDMVHISVANQHAIAIPNSYSTGSLLSISQGGTADLKEAQTAPIIAYFGKNSSGTIFKTCKLATSSLTHPLRSHRSRQMKDIPLVTTIIRYHKSGELNLLRRAVGCLNAMDNCICIPLIAAQDLSAEQSRSLSGMLGEFPWHESHGPVICHFVSKDGQSDLRSKVLNEALRQVSTRYAAFLDYDDLLFPDAYDWLVNRLKATNKAVSFGRVYSTTFNSRTGILLERAKSFQYGYTYADFLVNNHAPLHSFMLDISKLDLNKVVYHDEHKYMEDYYLTLQLFTEDNCDWAGLQSNKYIGDYVHSVDRSHTLAFADSNERNKMLSDPEYIRCLNRIKEIRSKASLSTKLT
jgi:2-polyprenyl-3-methyl-5-hydroxy-6-metoxy-1,4-benzoquinol methylase